MKNKYYYWTYTAVKNVLILLIICFIYSLIMCVFSDKDSPSKLVNEDLIFYFTMMGSIFLSVNNSSTLPIMLDISLSLGSTRKQAFMGVNILNAIFITFIALLFLILGLLMGNSLLEMLLPFISYSGAIMLSAGIGIFSATLNMAKSAKLGFRYLLLCFVAVILPLLLLFLSGTITNIINADTPEFVKEISTPIIIITLTAGILTYALSCLKMKKHIEIHEVRI